MNFFLELHLKFIIYPLLDCINHGQHIGLRSIFVINQKITMLLGYHRASDYKTF